MSKSLIFRLKRSTDIAYVATEPEGVYRISMADNSMWIVKTPFGKKSVTSLAEAKRTAERIRFNSLRFTEKGHR